MTAQALGTTGNGARHPHHPSWSLQGDAALPKGHIPVFRSGSSPCPKTTCVVGTPPPVPPTSASPEPHVVPHAVWTLLLSYPETTQARQAEGNSPNTHPSLLPVPSCVCTVA